MLYEVITCSGAYLGPLGKLALTRAASAGLFSAPVNERLSKLDGLELKDMDQFFYGPYRTDRITSYNVCYTKLLRRIRTWEPLNTDKTLQWLNQRLSVRVSVSFAGGEWKSGGRVEKRETGSYGKIEVYSRRLESGGDDVSKAVCEAIRTAGLDALPWGAEAAAYLNRARFANPERFASEALLARNNFV